MKQKELSERRKEQMAAALKRLMARKDLNKITIQDIADDCGMNRYTFYYHFQDIYDLLSWTFKRDFEQIFKDRARCATFAEWLRTILLYLKENEAVCRCALGSLGRSHFRTIFIEDLAQFLKPLLVDIRGERNITDTYLDFLAIFYLEAVTGVLIQWISGDILLSEEALVSYLCLTLDGGPEAAMERFERTAKGNFI